jgi:hypothetical protein
MPLVGLGPADKLTGARLDSGRKRRWKTHAPPPSSIVFYKVCSGDRSTKRGRKEEEGRRRREGRRC